MRSATFTACIVALLALVAPSGLAIDYTFQPTSGFWDVPANWYPGTGPPGADDKAIIPNGKTCIVREGSNYRAFVREIDVQSGGKLKIDAGYMELGVAQPGTAAVTLNGTLEMISSNTAYGEIYVGNAMVPFTGSGTLRGLQSPSDAARFSATTPLTPAGSRSPAR